MNKLIGYEQDILNKNILSIQVNLLNRCTSKCKSCRKYTWPDNKIPVNDLLKTLKVLKEKFGLKSVFFSGGEPLLYKDFMKVINFCCDNDIKYSLITTFISNNEQLLKKIAKTAYRIHVSIDSVDRESYKYIRGVDGLKYVEKNITLVNQNRDENMIPIRISSTIGIFNYSEVISLYEYAKENNCLINFYYLHTWDNLKMTDENIKEFYDSLRKIAIDEKENKKIISNAKILLLDEYNFSNKKEFNCYLPIHTIVIDTNGDLYPCCRLYDDNGEYGDQVKFSYGNICNKSEEEIENEIEKRKNIKYPIKNTACESCVQRYEGILGDLQNITEGKIETIFF